MKSKKLWSVGALVCGVVAASIGLMALERKLHEPCMIYFIPFGIETYSPVTEESIETGAAMIAETRQRGLYDDFEKLVSLKERVWPDSGRIRLKILQGSKSMVFDAEGVARIGKQGGISAPASVEALVKSILQTRETKIIRGIPPTPHFHE